MKIINMIVVSLCMMSLGACSGQDDLAQGKVIYTKACKVCHAQGINGAPILGNQKNWEPRKQQDLETLVMHATHGYGLMPAKGGKTELTEGEIRAAITYMLSTLDE